MSIVAPVIFPAMASHEVTFEEAATATKNSVVNKYLFQRMEKLHPSSITLAKAIGPLAFQPKYQAVKDQFEADKSRYLETGELPAE